MQIDRMQLRRRSTDDTGRSVDWQAWLSRAAWQDAALLKRDGDSWVRALPAPPGCGFTEVVVKCRVDRGLRAAIKRFARSSRGDRQWRGARWLLGRGLRSARPLALVRARVDGVPCELLILERLRGRSVLEHLASGDLTTAQQHQVAGELGTLLASLIGSGRYNRDGKPSNLMVVTDAGGHLRVATIDTVAIRRSRSASGSLAAMLASLYIEPWGCGIPPRAALCARVILASVSGTTPAANPGPPEPSAGTRESFRRAWAASVHAVRAHGDPVPRINPLA